MRLSAMLNKLRSQRRPVRFLTSRLLARSRLSRAFTIQQPGFKLKFHPASIPMTLWVDPHALDEGIGFVRSFLRPADTFVDVGADVGQLTIQAALCVENPKNVVCIEAHPTTFGYLEENLALNKLRDVTAIHCAIGAAEGKVSFTSKYSDDQNEISDEGDVEVPIRPLDQLLSLESVTLLKIDVEGFELFVLQGARETLAKTDAVYFEAYDPLYAKHDYSFAHVAALLRESGFSIYAVEGTKLTPFEQTASPNFVNLLALRSLPLALSRGFSIEAQARALA